MFNGKKLSSVSLYNEKHVSNIAVYESPDGVSQEDNSITIVNQMKTPISIYQIVYQVLPLTDSFTQSKDFTTSDSFTKTEQFSRTNDFTRTGDFSKSWLFSGTGYFSVSDQFSKSALFSRTELFSQSGKFSKSDYFSQSNDFTKSKQFTRTGFFSKTKYFSESGKFSRFELFSESGKFSRSNSFSKTSDFTSSKDFSSTDLFSGTEYFSLMGKFTKTDIFTYSKLFSLTDQFTQTNDFSQTKMFSESKKFTRTKGFTRSQGFSESVAFTASALFYEEDNSCLFESQEENYTTRFCNFTVNDKNDAIIHVIKSNFTDYINENSGAAIYIKNFGINGTSISFTNCVSTNGGGGSIYIKNTYDLLHGLTLQDSLFENCEALFGGACYIYSNSENNELQIFRCNFSQNIATEKKGTAENKNLFGGDRIFVTAKNLNILNSTFKKGKSRSCNVKIYNVFDQESVKSIKLDENQNKIMISGCNFELDKGSKTAINYIDAIEESSFELVDCNFAGKMTKGSHYVDGKAGSKDKNNIKITSCEFEDKNDIAVKIDAFEEDLLIKNDVTQKKSNKIDLISYNLLILFILALVIVTLIVLVLKLEKRQYYFDDDAD